MSCSTPMFSPGHFHTWTVNSQCLCIYHTYQSKPIVCIHCHGQNPSSRYNNVFDSLVEYSQSYLINSRTPQMNELMASFPKFSLHETTPVNQLTNHCPHTPTLLNSKILHPPLEWH
uniref:Uncharacterized protein n=1 Tax=Rhizophora mucronata TaxID=61149 RepID=A0A2P2IM63_RHIMU